MELPPLDQAALREYTKFQVFFPVSEQPSNHAIVWEPLKTALLWSLQRWPILTGKVVPDGEREKVAVTYDASRKYSMTNLTTNIVTTSHALQINYTDLAARSMPTNAHLASIFTPMTDTTTDARVLQIHLCMLNGGFVVCINAHHSVLDGTAVHLFVKHWARKCNQLRHSQIINDYPQREVNWSTASIPTPVLDPSYIPRGYALQTTPARVENSEKASEAVGRIFKFDVEHLRDIASKLHPFAGHLTSQHILAALLWMYVTEARSRHLSEPRSKVFIPVNVRKLLWPDVKDPQYLGNAVIWTYADLPVDTLVTAARYYARNAGHDMTQLTTIAAEIHHAIKTVDTQCVAWLANGTFDYSRVAIDARFTNGADIYLLSWRHFFTDADFGGKIGRPRFVRAPEAPRDGANIVLSQSGNQLELLVQLQEPDMEVLCDEQDGLALWADEVLVA